MRIGFKKVIFHPNQKSSVSQILNQHNSPFRLQEKPINQRFPSGAVANQFSSIERYKSINKNNP